MVIVVREGQEFIERPFWVYIHINDQEASHAMREGVTEPLPVKIDTLMRSDIAFPHAAGGFTGRGENHYRGALITDWTLYNVSFDGYITALAARLHIAMLGQFKPSARAQRSTILVRMDSGRYAILVFTAD